MISALKGLEVRPIRFEERSRWAALMRSHHYLGFDGIVGESLYYVATLSSEWVALLGWGWAALRCSARDRWIGWSDIVRSRRLNRVTNNVRFLVLPDIKIKNLASRILSLNLKRLNRDWETFHGHPIDLAETFIDPSRFAGTCYKAANWIFLGQTSGYGRSHRGYTAHGCPKHVFVYPLCYDVQKRLSDPYVEDRKGKKLMIDIHKLPIEGRGGLIDALKTMIDPRTRAGRRHSLVSILAIATCAMLSGARGYQGIYQWALKLTPAQRKKFGCRNTLPSEPTFRRVLQSLNADVFDDLIGNWFSSLVTLKGKAIAVDGKTLRGSRDGDKKAIHLLSALLHEEKVTIAQREVGEKTNEIPTLKTLFDPLNIEGSIVTTDALHTQEETSRYLVRDKKADFLMTVKDNQPLLKKELESLEFEAFSPSGMVSGSHQGSWSLGNENNLLGSDEARHGVSIHRTGLSN